MEMFEPMLAKKFKNQNLDGDYIYEVKIDGGRAIATIKNGVHIQSRRMKFTDYKYPEIVKSLKKIDKNCVLDGEICCMKGGKSNFKLYQKRASCENSYKIKKRSKRIPLVFMAFDIIRLEGEDLTKHPLLKRKNILKELVKEDNHLKFVNHTKDKEELLKYARKNGLEGIMAKKKDSKYELGRRSSSWIKSKFKEDGDYTIYGFTSKDREVSALILGEGGKFKGKVNFSFGNDLYEKWEEKLKDLKIDKEHFELKPESKEEDIFFVKPKLTAKIVFQEKCKNGFRFPILKEIV